jgi:hypothetical protein
MRAIAAGSPQLPQGLPPSFSNDVQELANAALKLFGDIDGGDVPSPDDLARLNRALVAYDRDLAAARLTPPAATLAPFS